MSGSLYNAAVDQTVRVWSSQDRSDSTKEIDALLREGWQVVSVTGAGAGAGAPTGEREYGPPVAIDTRVYFFVVLERRRS